MLKVPERPAKRFLINKEPPMEIRNLKTFLRVAALRNFTAAAKELGYSQANVSAQIKQLEEEVGAPLFDRIGRGVAPTQYAEALLPHARAIINSAAQMENLFKPDEEITGTIRIGMIESLFHSIGKSWILAFHKAFPKVLVEMTVDAGVTLKDYLTQGTLDAACTIIDDPLTDEAWQVLYSADSRVVAVANPGHPLAKKKKILPADLAGQEIILMENNVPYNIRMREDLYRMGVELDPFLILQSSEMARQLTVAGPYLSVLPFYAVRESLEAGELAELPLPWLNLSQTVQFVLHRNKALLPHLAGAARIFEEEVASVLK